MRRLLAIGLTLATMGCATARPEPLASRSCDRVCQDGPNSGADDLPSACHCDWRVPPQRQRNENSLLAEIAVQTVLFLGAFLGRR
jgi:hypothetical protein